MEERIITKRKWSKPNSGRYNVSQSGNEKQENLPKQGILVVNHGYQSLFGISDSPSLKIKVCNIHYRLYES